MNRILALLALTAALTVSAAQAQPDLKDKRWHLIGVATGNNKVFYLDTQTIQRPSDNNVLVWTFSKAESDNGRYDMHRVEIDRANRQFRFHAIVHYAPNGRVISDSYVVTGWGGIAPGSIIEGLYDVIYGSNQLPPLAR